MTPAQKLTAVETVRSLIAVGYTPNHACTQASVSRSNFERWSRELAAADSDPWLAFAEKKPTGRPTAVTLTEEESAIARWHRATKGSLPVALHFFLIDERVRAEVKAAIRHIEEAAAVRSARPSYPPSVRRAFHVTAAEAAALRGKKATMSAEMISPRGMHYIDSEGKVIPILPGQLWEMDDYSCNQPFAYPDLESNELRIGRQVLAAMDVASGAWLAFDAIGRPRDAYRGEDITRYLERCFRAHGLPLFLRLERGSWDSSAVHGLDEKGVIAGWGALDEILHIQHVWKSKAKGMIESSFNQLQTWLSHAALDIGRTRGEFEAQAKALRQARDAVTLADVRKLGFWEQSQCITGHEAAAHIINSRPRTRDTIQKGLHISADDLRAQHGWHTTPFPEAHAWRFLPHKTCRSVMSGVVTVNPGGGYPEIQFAINGVDGLHLDHGHRVLIACDPARPELGAYIANADKSAKNRAAWGIGQHICTAPHMSTAPQFNLSGKRHHTTDLRNAASAAATTEFRAIRSAAPASNLRITVAAGGGKRTEITNVAEASRLPAPTTPAPDRQATALHTTPDRLTALRAAEEAAAALF